MNGLASKCNFGNITESMEKDVFIVKISNKYVQQKLRTEPKSTVNETIQFAISYEERALLQQSFENMDKPNLAPRSSFLHIQRIILTLLPISQCRKTPQGIRTRLRKHLIPNWIHKQSVFEN